MIPTVLPPHKKMFNFWWDKKEKPTPELIERRCGRCCTPVISSVRHCDGFVYCDKCKVINRMNKEKKDAIYEENAILKQSIRDRDFKVAQAYFKGRE